MGNGDILFMNGDNYVFPVTYGRMVERMREDVVLYDWLNIIFKLPDVDIYKRPGSIAWKDQRNRMEKKIIEEKGSSNVFYAAFGPYSIRMPEQHRLVPYGIVHRVVKEEELVKAYEVENVWRYYASESFYDNFERDFMNREICAYFHFSRGKGTT